MHKRLPAARRFVVKQRGNYKVESELSIYGHTGMYVIRALIQNHARICQRSIGSENPVLTQIEGLGKGTSRNRRHQSGLGSGDDSFCAVAKLREFLVFTRFGDDSWSGMYGWRVYSTFVVAVDWKVSSFDALRNASVRDDEEMAHRGNPLVTPCPRELGRSWCV